MRRTVTILCLLITLSAGGAQAGPPLADRVPAESVQYAGWAGSDEAFDNTGLARLAASPQTAQLMAAVLHALGPNEQQMTTLYLDLTRIVLRHRAAICAIQGSPRGPEHPIYGRLRFALRVELAGDRKAFATKLATFLQRRMRSARDVTIGTQSFRAFQSGGTGPAVLMGYVGDTFICAQGEALAGIMVAAGAGRHKSLLANPAFAAAYRQVDGPDTQLATYSNFAAIRDADATWKTLGLGKLTAMVSATRVVDGGLYTRMRALTPAPHRGVLMLAAGKYITRKDLAAAPGDSEWMVAWTLDPAKALDEARRIVAVFGPATSDAFAAKLAKIDRQLGLSLRNELLGCLGDQWMLVSAPSLGDMFTGTAFVVQVKDQEAFLAAEAKIKPVILRHLGSGSDGSDAPTLRTTTVESTKITSLHLGDTAEPLAAWAVHDGKLIYAGKPQVISAVITGTREGPLTASKDFRSASKHLSIRPSVVLYANVPKIARWLHDLPTIAPPMSASLMQELMKTGIGAHWLPMMTAFEKYCRPAITAVNSDAEGITLESYGSFPGGPPGMMASALAVGVVGISKARERAREVVNMTRVSNLAKAILLYMVPNNPPPSSLAVLVTEGYVKKDCFINAHTGKPGSFVYIRLPASAPGDLILVYEDPNITGHSRAAVGFADVRVETLDVNERFWKLIARSRAAAEGNR